MTLVAGFCYLDLVLWSLGACLMKNMGLPATWVASCPGAALFSGVLVGGAVVYGVGRTSLRGSGYPRQLRRVLPRLFARYTLSSGRNLKYGWGTVLPGEGGRLEAGDLAGIVRFVATERAVTQRDRGDAAACSGKTRRAICEELTVSPDT